MVRCSVQSIFGYISLPSAFTVYRWDAIEGPPLDDYFSVVHCNEFLRPDLPSGSHRRQVLGAGGSAASSIGIWDVTAFAAEGRILCHSIVMREGGRWRLQYLKVRD
jgi:hypothetical protein